jgi:hypothetical protein
MKAKEIIKLFSEMSPDEEVWITYITKEEIVVKFEEMEYEDDKGNLIDTSKIVNDSVVKDIFGSIDNDEYLWERFNDSYNDACNHYAEKLIEEVKEDTDLWDTEGETNVTSKDD